LGVVVDEAVVPFLILICFDSKELLTSLFIANGTLTIGGLSEWENTSRVYSGTVGDGLADGS